MTRHPLPWRWDVYFGRHPARLLDADDAVIFTLNADKVNGRVADIIEDDLPRLLDLLEQAKDIVQEFAPGHTVWMDEAEDLLARLPRRA